MIIATSDEEPKFSKLGVVGSWEPKKCMYMCQMMMNVLSTQVMSRDRGQEMGVVLHQPCFLWQGGIPPHLAGRDSTS